MLFQQFTYLHVLAIKTIFKQELVVKHTIEINNMDNNALEMKRKHLAAIEKLESCYNPIVEYNNYQENIKMSRDNELSRYSTL